MGREIGQKCMKSIVKLLVLAFFSVVASSQIYPHAFRGAKLEKSNNIFHLTLLFFIHLQKKLCLHVHLYKKTSIFVY